MKLIIFLVLLSTQCLGQLPVISIQAIPQSLVLPASTVQLKANITLAPGATVANSGWSQPAGQNAVIADNSTSTTASNLINISTYLFTYTVKDSKGQVGSITIAVPVTNSVTSIGTMIYNSIDSFSHVLDSEVVKTYNTLNNNIGPIDSLTIPINTIAYYKIKGICTDPISKEVGVTEKWLVVKNLNGIYSIPSPIITPFTYTGGGSVAFSGWTIILVANRLILKLQAPISKPVNWQFYYMKDIKSL